MKLFLIAALLAVAAAAPSDYYKAPEITIVSQSDVRNLDGSSQWSFANSDGTTREEAQVQKKLASGDGYDKEDVYGNTNKGASYHISPEGQRITLTWEANENGFQPKGDHLPVAPVYDGVPPVFDGVAPVAPALPYSRTGLGY